MFALCRYDDHVLEKPDYFPIWAHHLKKEHEYTLCAEGHCAGEPRGENNMPKFSEVSLIQPDAINKLIGIPLTWTNWDDKAPRGNKPKHF